VYEVSSGCRHSFPRRQTTKNQEMTITDTITAKRQNEEGNLTCLKQREATDKMVLLLVAKQLMGVSGEGIDPLFLDSLSGNEEAGEEEMKIDPQAHPQAIEERMSVIADLVVAQLKDTATKRLNLAKERLKAKQEFDRVNEDILKLDIAMESFEGCESERVTLVEQREGLGKEFETLEMELQGFTEGLMEELKESESQSERLQTMKGDLIAAMKWGQLESGDLYQPSVSSAPVVLLLFQQHCRQQVSLHSLTKAGMGEFLTADRLRRCGCSVNVLKAAGYVGSELRAGGFSALELKLGTFSVSEIHEAGYTLDEMRAIGISPSELKQIFSLSQLKEVGYSLSELVSGEHFPAYSVQELVKAGSSVQEMRDSGIPASKLRGVFSVQQLKQVGYTPAELKTGGHPEKEICSAGYSLHDMKTSGIPVSTYKSSSYSVTALKLLGFSAHELELGGYSLSSIRQSYSLQQMKDSGITSAILSNSGYRASELKAVGYSAGELSRGMHSAKVLLEAGYTLKEMKDDGVSPQKLRKVCTASELKHLGYSAKDLIAAGCSPKDLLIAEFTFEEMKASGMSPQELLSLGFCVGYLRYNGFTIQDLLQDRISLEEIYKAGYPFREMRNAGILPEDLKKLGCTASHLRFCGLSAAEAKRVGYSAEEMHRAGYNIKELRASGFVPGDLTDSRAGYTPKLFSMITLKAAGYSQEEISRGASGGGYH
jgi:ribosomal protein L13E